MTTNARFSHLTVVWTAGLMILALAACRPAVAPKRARGAKGSDNTVALHGRILAANGAAPKRADAHVVIPGAKMTSTETAKDGSFTIDVPIGSAFHLRVSAVDHVEADLPVILTNKAPISVTVRLAQDPFVRDAKEVKIAPDTGEGFSLKNAVSMRPEADGTFVWEENTNAKTVRYELLGTSSNDRSVNGTQSDAFEYDGDGDYESVVHVKGGHVRIVYDPAKLPPPAEGDLPVITWDADHADLQEMFHLQNAMNAARTRLMTGVQAYVKAHGSTKGYAFDTKSLARSLQADMGPDHDPEVRAFAGVLLAETALRLGHKLDAADAEKILDAAPPSSALWAFAPQSTTAAADAFGKKQKTTEILGRFVKQNPSRLVQAFSLASLGYQASKAHDLEKQRAVYTRLKKDYDDIKMMRYLLAELNPDKAIQAGKPVPPFKVVLLDGKTFTNEDLLGHYTLLDFWATWCGPCKAEMPNLDAAWKKFHRRNFQIVSFSFDQSADAVAKFRKGQWKMPWRHAFVKDGFRSELAKTFEVRGIPEPILVGPDGRIIAVEPQTRGKQLIATISQAMKHTKG